MRSKNSFRLIKCANCQICEANCLKRIFISCIPTSSTKYVLRCCFRWHCFSNTQILLIYVILVSGIRRCASKYKISCRTLLQPLRKDLPWELAYNIRLRRHHEWMGFQAVGQRRRSCLGSREAVPCHRSAIYHQVRSSKQISIALFASKVLWKRLYWKGD